MAKILCVLYDDPITGYSKTTIRDGIPELAQYPGGQTLPTPEKIYFIAGQLLGSVSGALGLEPHNWKHTCCLLDAAYIRLQSLAQARYAAGTREILENWFSGKPLREEYLIVDGGKLAGAGAHSYSAGNATAGSEEAAAFKTIG